MRASRRASACVVTGSGARQTTVEGSKLDGPVVEGRGQNHLRLQADQLGRIGLGQRRAAGIPADIDAEVLPFDPAELPQRMTERRYVRLQDRVRRRATHQHAHAPRLLRARRERPRGSRAADERYELAAVHSITSSARASSVGGISRPSAFATIRLITKSNLVGCSTGMSVGLVPRKILSTKSPPRLNWSRKLGP